MCDFFDCSKHSFFAVLRFKSSICISILVITVLKAYLDALPEEYRPKLAKAIGVIHRARFMGSRIGFLKGGLFQKQMPSNTLRRREIRGCDHTLNTLGNIHPLSLTFYEPPTKFE